MPACCDTPVRDAVTRGMCAAMMGDIGRHTGRQRGKELPMTTTAEKPLPLGATENVDEPQRTRRPHKEYPTVEDMVEEPDGDPNIIRGRE